MSLRLLIDEDSQGKLLVKTLRKAGHDVQTASEAGLGGKSDKAVLEHGIAEKRIVLTGNCSDFEALSERVLNKGGHHFGILLIHKLNNPTKDISVREIVLAISNLEATAIPVEDQVIVVNHYNYRLAPAGE